MRLQAPEAMPGKQVDVIIIINLMHGVRGPITSSNG